MTLTSFPNGIKVNDYAEASGVTFTVGTEETNVINVAIQLTDGAGDNLQSPSAVAFYLSDASNGLSLTSANDEVAIGTDGVYIETVADSSGVIVTEADGTADIDITDTSGASTYYVVLILPNGKLSVSDAVTFA